MAKRRRSRRIFPRVSVDSVLTLNRLIPYRNGESITAVSDRLGIAVLQKFLGPDWIARHVTEAAKGFLCNDTSTPLKRETHRMRRILLAEMLFNLQYVAGFDSCLEELAGGQIESAYGALEIGRLLTVKAVDPGMTFRFVTRCGIKKRDYDLSLKFSDGAFARAETKCKQEETAITLRTIEESMGQAKKQLPEGAPGIVFIKVPRNWLNDEKFAHDMHALADRFLARSPFIVAVQYYTATILRNEDALGETISELVAFSERINYGHKFKRFKDRDWRLFPDDPMPDVPRQRRNYNGLPDSWYRLFVGAR